MITFCNGQATIDDQMVLRKADEAFYQFIGQDIYAPISTRIFQSDYKRFQDALDELNSKNMEQNLVSVRIKNCDNKYCWVTIELSHEPLKLDGSSLFHLRLSAVSDGDSDDEITKELNHEYEALLELLGGTLLSYSSASNVLELYTQSASRQFPIYLGSLDEWREEYLKDKIAPESTEQFILLCKELKEGKKQIKRTIVTSAFSKKKEMEEHNIKCRTLSDVDGANKVVGCIVPTSQKKEMAGLDSDANMDVALSILNKKAITDYAKDMMYSPDNKVFLVILDLDNFKEINDSYGHMFGDEVLINTSEIIKEAVGSAGFVGRFGGDEMMLVLTQVESQAQLRNMLRSIRTNIEWAYKEKHADLHITCSMGVACYPDNGDNYDKIFQLADRMLYIAKQKGKNRYVIYTPEIHDRPADTSLSASGNHNLEQLRENKPAVMQRLVEEFLIRRIVTYETEMTELLYCFELDEIIIVTKGMPVAERWTKEGVFRDVEDKEFLTPEAGFLNSFDDNHLLVMNSIFNLEGKAPLLSSKLTVRGIESVLFYQFCKHDQYFGYIMFAKKSHRQMWAEYDKTLLSVVGKVMEMMLLEK